MMASNQTDCTKDTVKTSLSRRILMDVAPYLAILALLAIWFFASVANARIVASPLDVVVRLGKLSVTKLSGNYLWSHALASLTRVFAALFFAIIIGVPMGILIGWNRFFAKTIGTLFELIRPIPALAWIPLVITWFGIGETPKIIMVFLGALMPIVVNSYTAIKLVPPLYIDVGRMFNAVTGRQILTKVVLPASLPTIFAGIRNATSVGWMVVLAAEMLAAKSGLGFLINRGMESFDVALIMSGMVMIGVIGALLAVATNFIERRLCPWNIALTSD
jgi:taurine transport system permease protein